MLVNIQTLVDEAKCYEVIRQLRWPTGVQCPACGASDIVKRGMHTLGFEQSATFEQELEMTVKWYTANEWWWRKIKSGEYMEYYKAQYEKRLAESTAV